MTELTELVAELRALAEQGDIAAFCERAEHAHPSDLADVLVDLDKPLRLLLVKTLPNELVSDALAEMEPDEHPEEVLAALPPEDAAGIVDELEDDDAADIIGELPRDTATHILAVATESEDIQRLLEYDEDSAGGIMTSAFVSVLATMTSGEAIDDIRRQSDEVDEFYQIYVVEASGVLVGTLPLQKLVRTPAKQLVREIMEPVQAKVPVEEDQEDVARIMSRYNMASIPVVDDKDVMLGRITFDDVIDVVEAEQTEDLLKFSGGSGDEGLGATWKQSVTKRLPWLMINSLTASLSAGVVVLFGSTIERTVALAALLPVVAGLGGNAGTQALAVTVRRLSLGQVPSERAARVIKKELSVGLVNGLTMGLLIGTTAGLIWGVWQIGLVVMLAMWGNLIVAGIAGASIPLLLEHVGVDPAVASSVFVTALTDMCGYFLLLGLAATVIL